MWLFWAWDKRSLFLSMLKVEIDQIWIFHFLVLCLLESVQQNKNLSPRDIWSISTFNCLILSHKPLILLVLFPEQNCSDKDKSSPEMCPSCLATAIHKDRHDYMRKLLNLLRKILLEPIQGQISANFLKINQPVLFIYLLSESTTRDVDLICCHQS